MLPPYKTHNVDGKKITQKSTYQYESTCPLPALPVLCNDNNCFLLCTILKYNDMLLLAFFCGGLFHPNSYCVKLKSPSDQIYLTKRLTAYEYKLGKLELAIPVNVGYYPNVGN